MATQAHERIERVEHTLQCMSEDMRVLRAATPTDLAGFFDAWDANMAEMREEMSLLRHQIASAAQITFPLRTAPMTLLEHTTNYLDARERRQV